MHGVRRLIHHRIAAQWRLPVLVTSAFSPTAAYDLGNSSTITPGATFGINDGAPLTTFLFGDLRDGTTGSTIGGQQSGVAGATTWVVGS